MRFFRWFTLVLALVTSASPRAYSASSELEKQARRAFERAEKHFKAGLFAEALVEYQEGYDQRPLPGFLINIAQCQRRLGQLALARTTYRKFLIVAPDSPYVPDVKSLVSEIDELLDSTDSSASPPEPEDLSFLTDSDEESPSTNVLVTVPANGEPTSAPPKTHWWRLWGSVGGAVVVGLLTAVILSRSPDTTTIHDGSMGTLRR